MERSTLDNAMSPADLYLDLMKRCLTNWIYADKEIKIKKDDQAVLRQALVRAANLLPSKARVAVLEPIPDKPEARLDGWDWPPTAHTMIGMKRLDNLQFCVEDVLKNAVPGDLLEAGTWRGGASIFMRAVLKVHGVQDRRVWVADSFAGLPPPNAGKYPADAAARFHEAPELAVSQEEVQSNFQRYGLLDDQVQFLKGWFRDTLPTAPPERLAVLRADGDMYESTMDIVNNLYPKLSVGGYLVVDDYDLAACQKAIQDYRSAQGITEEIIPIQPTGAYWKRLSP